MKAKYYFAASALALAVLPAPALAQHMGHDAMPAEPAPTLRSIVGNLTRWPSSPDTVNLESRA